MNRFVSPRTTIVLIVAIGLVLALTGCGGKKEVELVPVGNLVDYRDPGFGFSLKHPEGWKADAQVGRAHFYNVDGVDMKFRDPLGNYPNGVVFAVDVTKTQYPNEERKKLADEMKASGMQVDPEEAVMVGGKEGTRVKYVAAYSKSSVITGYHIYIEADTLLYDIGAAGFGDTYDAYKLVLDTVLASFHFPRPVEPGRDQTLPSESFAQSDTKLFTFSYPDNFNFEQIPKGNNEIAVGLRGARLDAAIRFEVFDAKGLTVEKVVEQNKGRFPGASTGKTTVGGQQAITLTGSVTRDVERRMVFVVKDGKVYRIIMDWFKPQRAQYLAAYDQVLASVKFR
jgi:hypothetical protein